MSDSNLLLGISAIYYIIANVKMWEKAYENGYKIILKHENSVL